MLPAFALQTPFEWDEYDPAWERLEETGRVTLALDRQAQMRPTSVALLTTSTEQGPRVAAIGRLTKGRAITTFERTVALDDVHPLDPPLVVDEMVARLSSRLQTHASNTLKHGGVIPPRTWQGVREALQNYYPQAWHAIKTIEDEATPPAWTLRRTDRARQVVAEEKDAATLALSLTGMDRPRLPHWRPGPAPAPFLTGLENFNAYEDQLLERDLRVFGGWEQLRESAIGAVEFRDRQHHVTILNVNRTRVEETLGVDLIYYHATYRSFVLIQYKRLNTDKRGGLGFRPSRDQKFGRQVATMLELESRGWQTPEHHEDYRIGPTATYLKLCRPDMTLWERGLSRGMYLPVPYVKLLVESPSVKGPRGGVRITYENVGRYLTNTQFVELFQSGFIGSSRLALNKSKRPSVTL